MFLPVLDMLNNATFYIINQILNNQVFFNENVNKFSQPQQLLLNIIEDDLKVQKN